MKTRKEISESFILPPLQSSQAAIRTLQKNNILMAITNLRGSVLDTVETFFKDQPNWGLCRSTLLTLFGKGGLERVVTETMSEFFITGKPDKQQDGGKS